jgi:hypothetical protein
MSYHFTIKNNKSISGVQLLGSEFLPPLVKINPDHNLNEALSGFSKYYIPGKSSRGVALTVSAEEYDLGINVGASKDDYFLATRMALALAEMNGSLVSPEDDEDLPIKDAALAYNEEWAMAHQYQGISTVRHIVGKDKSIVSLNGCIRNYHFGPYTLNLLETDSPTDEVFGDRLIEEIRKLQFIENHEAGLEIPTKMEGDFPEGVKTLIVVLPGVKLLLIKADFVVLRHGNDVVKIPYADLIEHQSDKLIRLDEEQYILLPIGITDYTEMFNMFTLTHGVKPGNNNTSKKWWQFWK